MMICVPLSAAAAAAAAIFWISPVNQSTSADVAVLIVAPTGGRCRFFFLRDATERKEQIASFQKFLPFPSSVTFSLVPVQYSTTSLQVQGSI
jgi:hypothetical protein